MYSHFNKLYQTVIDYNSDTIIIILLLAGLLEREKSVNPLDCIFKIHFTILSILYIYIVDRETYLALHNWSLSDCIPMYFISILLQMLTTDFLSRIVLSAQSAVIADTVLQEKVKPWSGQNLPTPPLNTALRSLQSILHSFKFIN